MLEFKQQRNDEFYRLCKQIIAKSKTPVNIRQTIKCAIHTPATSFFISETRIAKIIRAPLTDCPKSEAKANLFNMIKHLYFEEKMTHPQMSAEAIAKNIIFYRSAPRFYISQATALNIFYNELNKRKLTL